MYAPTGRGEKWVMNSEGIVLEYSSEPFHKSDEIIAGINAHYGTSFYQEDDIDKDFTIGEAMPNWDAYEKIEMPAEKLADGYYKIPIEIVWGTQSYAAILKENDIVLLNAKGNNTYEEIAGYNYMGNNIGYNDKYDVVTNVLNKYDNIKQINLVIAPSEIKDFEKYQTLE